MYSVSMSTLSVHSQKIKQFSNLELLAKQVVEGFITGLHKSPFHGFSVEFAEHRLYNTGEPTRHIDWKLYGRSDKLFVKRYEEETNLRCQLVIDVSSSMDYPADGALTKLQFSVQAAAALTHLLKSQRDAFGLSLFADQVELHTDARSSSVHSKMIFSHLEGLLEPRTGQKKSFATDALHEVAEKIHRRSLVVIFTDMLDNSGRSNDDLWRALQHLRHNKHEVILFHVTDKAHEIDFNFDNRPHHFIDLETGEELKLNPAEVRTAYLQASQQHLDEIKLKCAQFRTDLIEADIALGFDQVLMPYLLKRKSLY